MIDYSKVLTMPAYEVRQEEKESFFLKYLSELTSIHRTRCEKYNRFLELVDKKKNYFHIEDIPFLPVRVFKDLNLKSVSEKEVFKIMTSSGTTGQKTSKIVLDKKTAANQQKTLAEIMSSYLGSKRVPMLIIDSESVIKDRKMFSARGAGILGFSIFGSQRLFALDENMNLQVDKIRDFLENHKGERILIFGFTYMIWEFFYKVLAENHESIDIENGILFHGGGWKKLQAESVGAEEFKKCIEAVSGIKDIHDYYGMVEQTGCIYVECEEGYLHTSSYSDIITRRGEDFSPCNIGEEGIIQVLSLLPESYPGHSILTEDRGTIVGVDDCKCGKCGKYFIINGRLKNAEVRGCSDTFERKV